MCLFVQNARTMTSNVAVSLEPYIQKHVLKTFKWVLNPELRKLFLMRGEPTWEVHNKYFERVLQDHSQRVYAILAGDEHVGNCGLKNLLSLRKVGELWIYIGEPSIRGKGIGKRATELLLHEGFEVLGLKMIYTHVADFNTAARRLYKKLGFHEVPLINDSNEWANRQCKIIRMELKKQA